MHDHAPRTLVEESSVTVDAHLVADERRSGSGCVEAADFGTRKGHLYHATLYVFGGTSMLVELNITPLGVGTHISEAVAEAVKLVDDSGLPYQLTPTGTCIEGDWDEVMTVVRQCHDRVRELSPHIVTMIQIEDEEGAQDKLTQNILSVEERIGHPLRRRASEAPTN
jgi:uncharacterized protein (TIGR00106 family)